MCVCVRARARVCVCVSGGGGRGGAREVLRFKGLYRSWQFIVGVSRIPRAPPCKITQAPVDWWRTSYFCVRRQSIETRAWEDRAQLSAGHRTPLPPVLIPSTPSVVSLWSGYHCLWVESKWVSWGGTGWVVGDSEVTRARARTHTYKLTRARAHTHTHTHTHTHVMHAHIYTYTQVHTLLNTCTHTRAHTHTHALTKLLFSIRLAWEQRDRESRFMQLICSAHDLTSYLNKLWCQYSLLTDHVYKVFKCEYFFYYFFLIPDDFTRKFTCWQTIKQILHAQANTNIAYTAKRN